MRGEGVHRLGTDAVQAHGELKDLVIVLGARVDDRDAINDLPQRNAAPVIPDDHLSIVELDANRVSVAHDELIHTIVDDFLEQDVDAVVQVAPVAEPANIHAGPKTNVLQGRECLDLTLVVGVRVLLGTHVSPSCQSCMNLADFRAERQRFFPRCRLSSATPGGVDSRRNLADTFPVRARYRISKALTSTTRTAAAIAIGVSVLLLSSCATAELERLDVALSEARAEVNALSSRVEKLENRNRAARERAATLERELEQMQARLSTVLELTGTESPEAAVQEIESLLQEVESLRELIEDQAFARSLLEALPAAPRNGPEAAPSDPPPEEPARPAPGAGAD